MNKNSSNKKIWQRLEFYFLFILAIAIIVLVFQLLSLQILPNKYTISIIIVLLLFFSLISFLLMSKRINKFNRNLGNIVCVILVIFLCFGNFYVYKGGQTLANISNANIKTNAISVIVMKDSKVEKDTLESLVNESFGILNQQDRENTNLAIDDFNKKVNGQIKTAEYNSAFDLAKALYGGKVDAIILNEAYRGTFQDNDQITDFAKFDTDTKVVYQVEIHTETKDTSKTVDVTKSPFNVYISGIDTYGSISSVARTDVNMVATVNPTTHQILLTSIPRDYYVAQTCQGGQLDKLTHSGIFGVDCSISSVGNLFGIEVNYYARVNFTSLTSIINSLGGVSVENPNNFSGNRGTYFPSGTISLNGEDALEFSRERYSFADGDRERGKNQMRVLTGIINKAISPSIITNYSSVMNAISGSFETNMDSSDITKFIQKQLDTMSGWNIVQNTVSGSGGTDWTPANGFNAYVMYPDQSTVDNAKSLINQVLNGEIINP